MPEATRLTEEQARFVDRFIRPDASRRQKNAVTKAYLEFERRRIKVEHEFARLPSDHAQAKAWRQSLDKAKAEVQEKGNFAAAYHSLKQVKLDARRAADRFVRELSAEGMRERAKTFEVAALEFFRLREVVRSGCEELIREVVNKCPDARACTEAEKAFLAVKESLEQEKIWRPKLVGLDAQRTAARDLLRNTRPGQTLAGLHHDAVLLQKERGVDMRELVTQAIKAGGLFSNAGADFLTEEILMEEFDAQEKRFEDTLRAKKDLSAFQTRDPDPELDRLQELVARDESAFKRAKKKYMQGAADDKELLGLTAEAARNAAPLPTFDTAKLVGTVGDLVIDGVPEDVDDDTIERLCADAGQELSQFVDRQSPQSDLAFDLILKSPEDFVKEIAQALGLSQAKPSAQQNKLITKMADALASMALSKAPNRMSADQESVTFDNRTYKESKVLGKGGIGIATLFEDENEPGRFIVVKSLKEPEYREDMAQELRVHRHAMGGENGTGHRNMVGLKGVAVSNDGGLHMILEYAEGGDLNRVGNCIQQALSSGLIPQAAHHALTQHFFTQAVEGLKHVQSMNMTHHDIKDLNYLMAADGTVKIADFGSGQIADNPEGRVANNRKVTPKYAAPEVVNGGSAQILTGKADTYSLGTMLAALSGDYMGLDGDKSGQYAPDPDKAVTSLDRLKKAVMDSDPAKRPTLEALQFSAYLEDARNNYDEPGIQELATSLMAYSMKVGEEIAPLEKAILWCKAQIAGESRQKLPGLARRTVEEIDKRIKEHRSVIADKQRKIDAILERADVKPVLEALKQAAQPFGQSASPRADSDGRKTLSADAPLPPEELKVARAALHEEIIQRRK